MIYLPGTVEEMSKVDWPVSEVVDWIFSIVRLVCGLMVTD